MSIIAIDTVEQFENILLNTPDKKFLLVDFYADWCGPCKKMEPFLEEFSETISENIVYSKINVDNSALHPIMRKYVVKCMPTFILLPMGSTDIPVALPKLEGFDPDSLKKLLLFNN